MTFISVYIVNNKIYKFVMIKTDILENKYIEILKYLTYQDIPIDNKLFKEINDVDKILKSNSIKDNVLKSENIKELIDIFSDICIKNKIDYLYYIFIFRIITK